MVLKAVPCLFDEALWLLMGGGLGVTEASLIRSNLFLVNQGKVVLHIIQQFVFCGLKCVNVRILMKVGIKNFINKTVFTKDFLKAPCTVCVMVPGQIKVNPATPSASYLSFL